jgi:tetratricopeptide (TPR) repeat protein
MAEPDLTYDKRAHDLVQQGKMREALDFYDRALMNTPENDVFLNNKAIALITLARYEEGLVCTQKAISINPGAVEAWITMGVALDNLGRHHEASEALEHAVELNPYHSYARALLGIVYQKMDMGDRAEVQNRKLQEIVFPNEFAGFYFTLSAFLLGILLGGIRSVDRKPFEVGFGSQLIIIFFFCMICWLYWRSHRMWQEVNRHAILLPYQLPAKRESYSGGLYVVTLIMMGVFLIGIFLGSNIRSYL